MSKGNDFFSTIIILAISFVFITFVLPLLVGIVGTMFTINTFTYSLLPKAELPRTNSGQFIVTEKNYSNWHTMARIETSNGNTARLTGEYVVRAFPTVSSTCYKIKNCQNYESEFVNLTYKDANVYLIKKTDDNLFTDAVTELKSRAHGHNQQLKGNYDIDITFEAPYELKQLKKQLTFLEEVDTFSNPKDRNKKAHNNTVSFARNNCRNNGLGCNAKATLLYDYSVFGGPQFILKR